MVLWWRSPTRCGEAGLTSLDVLELSLGLVSLLRQSVALREQRQKGRPVRSRSTTHRAHGSPIPAEYNYTQNTGSQPKTDAYTQSAGLPELISLHLIPTDDYWFVSRLAYCYHTLAIKSVWLSDSQRTVRKYSQNFIKSLLDLVCLLPL